MKQRHSSSSSRGDLATEPAATEPVTGAGAERRPSIPGAWPAGPLSPVPHTRPPRFTSDSYCGQDSSGLGPSPTGRCHQSYVRYNSDVSSVDWLEGSPLAARQQQPMLGSDISPAGTSTGHWPGFEAAVPSPTRLPAARVCGPRADGCILLAQQPSGMELDDFLGPPTGAGVDHHQQQEQQQLQRQQLQRQGSPPGEHMEDQQEWSVGSDGPWDELMGIIPEDEDFDLPGVADLPVQDAAASQQQHMQPQQPLMQPEQQVPVQVHVQQHSCPLPSFCRQGSLASAPAGAPVSGMGCGHLGATHTATRVCAVQPKALERGPLSRGAGDREEAARPSGGAFLPHFWPGSAGLVQRAVKHAHAGSQLPAQLSVTPMLRPAASRAVQPADNTVELMTRISLQLFHVMPHELPQGLHEALAYMLTADSRRTS